MLLPKNPDRTDPSFGDVYFPSSLRPLSIVDATNRFLANAFRRKLEALVLKDIMPTQIGFLPGRSLLENVLDIGYAAQKVSLKKGPDGAIVLFDFKVASPSMSHDVI